MHTKIGMIWLFTLSIPVLLLLFGMYCRLIIFQLYFFIACNLNLLQGKFFKESFHTLHHYWSMNNLGKEYCSIKFIASYFSKLQLRRFHLRTYITLFSPSEQLQPPWKMILVMSCPSHHIIF